MPVEYIYEIPRTYAASRFPIELIERWARLLIK